MDTLNQFSGNIVQVVIKCGREKELDCFWKMLSNQLSLKYGSILEQAGGVLRKRKFTSEEETNSSGSPGRALSQVKFLLLDSGDNLGMLTH